MIGDEDSVDVYMPWFLGDYWRDTGDLTCTEHGAYLQLLGRLWNAKGYLDFDPARLGRLISLDPAKWDAVWARIRRFFIVAEGRLCQKRNLYELEQAKLKRRTKREKAQAAALAGWAKRQTAAAGRGRRGAKRDAGASRAEPCEPCPSPASASSSAPAEQIPPTPRRRGGAPDESVSFQAWWQAYPRKAARERAWRAWQRTAPDHPPLPEMLRTLEWQRRLDFDRRPPDRVPYPATYLHGGQYRDEPPPEKGASSPRPPRKQREQHDSEPVDIASIMATWPPKEATPP